MDAELLGQYLQRVGYEGEWRPEPDVLKTLHRLHPTALPFENIDPFLGKTNALDIDVVARKFLSSRRGGWCFEHNLLFRAVLDQFGFETFFMAGRVILNQPDGAIMPRHHMLLGVKCNEESYVADVGFGGLTLSGPVKLVEGEVQDTPHELARICTIGDKKVLQVQLAGQWVSLYSFTLEREMMPDFETANYYLSNCADSLFRKGLMAATLGDGFRLNLRGRRLTRRPNSGPPVVRELEGAEKIMEALREEFGIRLGDEESNDLRRALEGATT